MKVIFPDLQRIQEAITKSGPEGAKVAARALRSEAQEAFAVSQDEVPVDTGALKASGRVRPDSGVYNRGNEVYVELTYGGTAVDYGVYVHENLEANHPHGKAKYLEDPMTRQVNGISGRIADKVERATKGMLR
jgi:hypothetical protein